MAETLKYRTYHLLGSGGMAEVHLGALVAENGIHRRVAIKRLPWPLSRDAEAVERFLGEAALLSRLTHPNIVSIIDYQTDETGPFLVMDYVDGCTLSKLLSRGACPPSTAVHIAMEMLRALAYVHGMPIEAGMRGLVHRDISPQNVLLSWEGTVVVSDFGVAKVMETLGGVRSRSFHGKLAYSSPEQVKKQTLDGRSDLFSVGVVLWEMLSGRSLFHDAIRHLTVSNVLFRTVPPLDGRPISVELQAVVARLLKRDVNERYPTAEDAMVELLRCPDWPRSGRDELAHLLATRFERLRRSLVAVADPFGPGKTSGGGERTASVELGVERDSPAASRAVSHSARYLMASIALAIVLVGALLLADRRASSHLAGATPAPSVAPTIEAPSERAPSPAASPASMSPRRDALEMAKDVTPGALDERSTMRARESIRAANARSPSSRGGAPATPGAAEADAARGDRSADGASIYPKDIRAKLSAAGSSATK